ncbi:MAG: hypothetical protein HC767_14950 [Akkermansiaceae bacterium]|nr:hypothetical protein [Akkermansiaceae bacterium]
MVSTKIGTEGMNLIAEEQILEADQALDFARQILRLNSDPQLWQDLSNHAQQAIAHYSPTAVQLKVAESFSANHLAHYAIQFIKLWR